VGLPTGPAHWAALVAGHFRLLPKMVVEREDFLRVKTQYGGTTQKTGRIQYLTYLPAS